MANETPAAGGAAPAAKSKSGVMLLAISLGAAVVGGGTGALLVAPKLLARADRSVDSTTATAGEEQGGHRWAKEGTGKAGKIFRLDNMIVNPAGSEGTRFLMASVAFELEDDAAQAKLKEREVELRDLVVAKLESLTMPMLTQSSARDSLKAQLGREVVGLLGQNAKVKVYLPQFVIQ